MNCSKCGATFQPPRQRTGRPRTRCDSCRSNHDKIAGAKWQKLRAQVLREQPYCAVIGCGSQAVEVDHIHPLAAGGDPYDRANLQGLCKSHNASKGARTAVPVPNPRRAMPTLPAGHVTRECLCDDPEGHGHTAGNPMAIGLAGGNTWTPVALWTGP